MLTQIDFNRLKVFFYIYEHQSIVKTAAKLHVTRSAISQHLKKLEQELKIHLFTRLHRKLVPTPEAKRLFDVLQPFFTELEIELKSIHEGKTQPSGLVNIGAPVEFGKTYLPKIIGGFRRKYPQVTFSISLGNPEELLQMVKDGRADFALVDLFLTQHEYLGDSTIFHISPIINEEIILIASKHYTDKVLGGRFDSSSLLKQDFIAYRNNISVLRSWFKHHFHTTSINPNVVLTVDSVRAVVSAVEAHIGIGIVPDHVVFTQCKANQIIAIPTPKENLVNAISLLQLQEKVPNLAEKSFLKYLKSLVSKSPSLSNLTPFLEKEYNKTTLHR